MNVQDKRTRDKAVSCEPENVQDRAARVMFYSHDTFGLGHLRRSRVLASAITASDQNTSAIILTGSPVAGRFAFPERVDHVRLPGVTKQTDGSYVSSTLGLNIDETTSLRSGLIQSAIEQYEPDLLVVDKEPTGFRGELLPSLQWLKDRRTTKLVLGLRDVLDEPAVLATEWERKGATVAADKFYDELWVYGPKWFYDPTKGLALSPQTRARMYWTGFIKREITEAVDTPDEPFVLITPGGGGDGAALVDLVLSAYETDPTVLPNAALVYGPFLSGDTRDAFEARVAALNGRVTAIGFDAQIESLFAAAQGVICMGGYNTFCEVLSFDKRAVIVPRTVPRLEQYIRAARAEELGLVRMLDEKRQGMTPESMINAIQGLSDQAKPSEAGVDGLLDGLDVVVARAKALMADK